ncbi:MAG: long-chain fatty acid--CoA ligase [Sulfuriflexus sp.]|nr:long-chain fatty acid--CoA ligase [Sulfuriflexus sp.]
MSHSEDIITTESAGTLDGLFRARIQRSPDKMAYRQFNKSSALWEDFSWQEVGEKVARWQKALSKTQLQAGDRVALLLRNGVDWVVAEQAAMGMGLVIVPLYCDDRPDNIAFILNDSATQMLVANDAMWRRVQSACVDVESLKNVIIVPVDSEAKGIEENEQVHIAENWLTDEAGELQSHEREPKELATIVYTSGTTGRPKGVMLSHHNILSITNSILLSFTIYTDDLFLSFLPLSHTFERTVGHFMPMMAGAAVAYSRSIALLADDMQQLKPTVLVAVPRIFERIHGRMQQQLSKKSFIARGLFNLTVTLGWSRFNKQQGRGSWFMPLIYVPLLAILSPLVIKTFCQRLGGRMRLTVSGGAALPLPVARVMIGLGLNITQGYGLTETSPVICSNPIDDNDPSSVGVTLKGIETRIGENDELQVKTPGMMLGYWNNHAATSEIISADGWVHTGDQARIENNHIYITGRLKDILILSNGEKVPPTDMESTMIMDPLFEQVLVIGEGQSFLSALVVLNTDEWIKLANHFVVNPYHNEGLNDSRVHSHILAIMKKSLHEFPSYAKIRRVSLSLEQWTVENDLMTPTLKIKRNKVIELNADNIMNIYS